MKQNGLAQLTRWLGRQKSSSCKQHSHSYLGLPKKRGDLELAVPAAFIAKKYFIAVGLLIALAFSLAQTPGLADGTTRRLPYPIETSLAQQAAEQGLDDRVQQIMEKIQDAAATARFTPGGTVFPARIPEPAPTTWYTALIDLLVRCVFEILKPIAEGLVTFVITLVHNANIASPYDKAYRLPGGTVDIPYDLVTTPVKLGIRQGYVVMQALAINLLLLLFILAIWKYWVHPHTRHGHQFLGAVGRLIATTGLILFWPVLSFHIVQISNEMIDYVFRSITVDQLSAAVERVISAAVQGGLGLLGGQAMRLLGTGGAIVERATTQIVGGILSFIFLSVILYEAIYLIVLKSVQTGLLIAQFMFAPMFLVFFATPDTERVATGFVRSCVEISLWTFVWAGLLKILVVILSVQSQDSAWGQFIMLIGILQIMLHVPEFMARAQISPVSDFVSPRGVTGGLAALASSLKEAGLKLKDYVTEKNDKTNLLDQGGKGAGLSPSPSFDGSGTGVAQDKPKSKKKEDSATNVPPSAGSLATNAASGTSAGGGSTTGAGQSLPTSPPISTPPGQAGLGASKKNRFDKAGATGNKALEDPLAALASQLDRGQLGESEGQSASINHDGEKGITGLTYGKRMSARDRAKAFAVAALAQELLRNPAMRSALENGWRPDPFSSTPLQKQTENFNRSINEAAIRGAESYLSGQKGNKATELLKQAHGSMTPAREEEMLGGLMDANQPHSVFNPDYVRNRQAVQGAGLPVNAATMAAAQLPVMKRLSGDEFNAAYARLAGAAGTSPALAGLTPGSAAHTAMLGREMGKMSPARARAAAAVGVASMGWAESANFDEDDWNAWVDTVADVVARGGDKNELGAYSKLRGFAPHFGGAQSRGNAQRPNLAHAANAVVAMNRQGFDNAAYADANLTGQMFARNNFNGRSMAAAMSLARINGFENLANQDIEDVGEMVDALDYRINDAVSCLPLARSIAAHNGGTLPNVGMLDRVRGAGMGVNAAVVAAARHTVLQGMTGGQSGNAIRSMVTAFSNGQPDRIDQAAAAIDTLTDGQAQMYVDCARQDPGSAYPLHVLEQAQGIEALPSFNGRLSDAARVLTLGTAAVAQAGGSLGAPQVAVAIRRMVTSPARFPASSFNNAQVITVVEGASAADMGNPTFVEALAGGAVILGDGSSYTRANIDSLCNMATDLGISPLAIARPDFETYHVLQQLHQGSGATFTPSKQQIRAVTVSGILKNSAGATLPQVHAVMHPAMGDVNSGSASSLSDGVIQYATVIATNRANATGTTVDAMLIAAEVDNMPEEVVRACIVTQQRENAAACGKVQFINHLAQSSRGNNLPKVHAAYADVQNYVNAGVPAGPPSGLGGATVNTVRSAGSSYYQLYEAQEQWDEEAAIEVRQTLQQGGIKEQIINTPAVASEARACYSYNPSLVPHFITALRRLGPESANLGTAVLIKDLKERYNWTDNQINDSTLTIAEHMLVHGDEPTFDNVRNANLSNYSNPNPIGPNQLVVPAPNSNFWQ